jgi:hypothetical protein
VDYCTIDITVIGEKLRCQTTVYNRIIKFPSIFSYIHIEMLVLNSEFEVIMPVEFCFQKNHINQFCNTRTSNF